MPWYAYNEPFKVRFLDSSNKCSAVTSLSNKLTDDCKEPPPLAVNSTAIASTYKLDRINAAIQNGYTSVHEFCVVPKNLSKCCMQLHGCVKCAQQTGRCLSLSLPNEARLGSAHSINVVHKITNSILWGSLSLLKNWKWNGSQWNLPYQISIKSVEAFTGYNSRSIHSLMWN